MGRAVRGLAALFAVAALSIGAAATAGALPAHSADISHGGPLVSPVAPPGGGPSPSGLHAQAFADPGVLSFGDAAYRGAPTAGPPLAAPVVGMAAMPDSGGYWLAAADGGVFSYGDAAFHGSAGSIGLNAPVVGMAATPDGGGYWLVALDGGIFSYGDARFYGSMGGTRLNQPVLGMAATPDGGGYWLVAADGGIFSFGDAAFYGSTGAMVLNSPVVGMAPTLDGGGYRLVAGDGGVFDFGDAGFYGSTGNQSIAASVAGMAATPTGHGYWLVGSDGTVYPFGDATFHGDNSAVSPSEPVAGIVPTRSGNGYWLLEPDAFPVGFSHPGPPGPVVAAAASQIRADPYSGSFCNPYGPCEEWCALFATWAWNAAGVPIPRYAFTGDIYNWAAANTAVLAPTARPAPGDAVVYGTGPQTVDTSVHVGIVAQVWPDGAIDTVEGDAGPGPFGHYSVVINGPFLPSDSLTYNGAGIYAYAVP